MKSVSKKKALFGGLMVLVFVVAAGLMVGGVGVSTAKTSVKPQPCSLSKTQNNPLDKNVIYVAQNDPCPNGHTCITFVCGGTTERSVCCPRGYPYLSHCDCKCYEASPDCNSYTRCSQP